MFTIHYEDKIRPVWNEESQEWTNIPLSGVTDFIDAIDNYKNNGGAGDIACVLMGHAHADRLHIGKTGIPYIISACDRRRGLKSVDSETGDVYIDIKNDRSIGTINEQHFEVVIIDKTNRKISLIPIGAKSFDGYDDEVGKEVNIREINY